MPDCRSVFRELPSATSRLAVVSPRDSPTGFSMAPESGLVDITTCADADTTELDPANRFQVLPRNPL